MRRSMQRAAAMILALWACSLTSPAAVGEEGGAVPGDPSATRYVVVLRGEPLALYRGGVAGIPSSAPSPGAQLDVLSPAAERYLVHLAEQQRGIADAVGIEISVSYRVTLNGFAAELSPTQLALLRARDDVQRVVADAVRTPDGAAGAAPGAADQSATGLDAAWARAGGVDAAGTGVVIGVVGTGIAPGHPSFAGEPLTATAPEGEPYLEGTVVVAPRADGGVFRSETVSGQDWSKRDYSSKIVGAQYFSTGALAAGNDLTADHLSPLDADGQGSRVAGVAAGAAGVSAQVGGLGSTAVSGTAPAARLAAYKACFAGPNVLTRDDDVCVLSDLLAAIDQAVADGVDVIDYAVAPAPPAPGGALAAEDLALMGAAAAGVVVVAGVGDTGPGAGTAGHAAPGVLAVAASDDSGVAAYSARGPAAPPAGALPAPAVTAPGGPVLTADGAGPDGAPAFGFAAGTGVAAARTAGLAALYLGVHPTATVSEVLSALTTTARAVETPASEAPVLAEGAGEVDPEALIDPGLVYLSGVDDWGALRGEGADDDASVNLPAVQLPAVGASASVTRVATALRPGTYTVHAELPGFEVVVEPAVLRFARAGESQEFRVTLTRAGASADRWASGAVTWVAGDLEVRMPLSIRPDADDR